MRRPTLSRLRRRDDRRGVAILMVVATVMFLTVLVTDVSFGARVRFLAAVHERDEAKAYWLANTGVNLYRLILTANMQLAKNRQAQSLLSSMGINGADAIWQMIPFVNTGLLRMLLTSNGSLDDEEVQNYKQTGEVSEEVREKSESQGSSRFGAVNFLDFDGDFNASVRGEDCRVNVNRLAIRSSDQAVMDTDVGQQLYGLMSGEDNDEFFRDHNLEKTDLIGNLADWVDADNQVSSGKGGYEDAFYNQQKYPYLAKNAPFDTLEEIRLVEGWQDDVYDRFADKITIWGQGKVNVNCASDEVLIGLFRAYGGGASSYDELERLVQTMREAMTLSTFTNAQSFYTWLKANAPFEPYQTIAQAVSTSTKFFTIESTGQEGDATVKITAVVDYTTTTGTVLYWRVE
jgi:general secretion pathway protein K